MNQLSGNIFMVVAPSGAGKSSLVNAVLKNDDSINLSISCTTRNPRPGEENKKHYRFVSIDQFKKLRDQNNMLEWAEVHGNFYGTPRDKVDQALENGQDIILEIDWQGARQVKSHFPKAIGIFILPPSIEALKTRLHKRGQDSEDVITKRLLAAGSEMAHASDCDYVIINQEFNIALLQMQQIIAAARLSFVAQSNRHADLFTQLGIPKTLSNIN